MNKRDLRWITAAISPQSILDTVSLHQHCIVGDTLKYNNRNNLICLALCSPKRWNPMFSKCNSSRVSDKRIFPRISHMPIRKSVQNPYYLVQKIAGASIQKENSNNRQLPPVPFREGGSIIQIVLTLSVNTHSVHLPRLYFFNCKMAWFMLASCAHYCSHES